MHSASHADTPSAVHRPTRVVIVGGGYGGAYCAQHLEKLLGRRVVRPRLQDAASILSKRPDAVEVLLIDRNNFFIFYPLLIEAGTGSLEPRHAVVSLRSFLRRAGFRMAEVVGVDVLRRIVRLREGDSGQRTLTSTLSQGEREGEPERIEAESSGREVAFDHLVIAAGSVTLRPPIPGLREHAFDIKGLSDAVALRDRAIRLLERADACVDSAERRSLLHFVVVGASFTGAEVAGEFHEFLQRAARRYPNISKDDCRVTIIERDRRILRPLTERLSAYAEQAMRKRGIDIRLNTSVAQVGADHVVLTTGERLEAHTTIWCAGIEPSPLVRSLDLPRDERGYLQCEPTGQVKGHTNIWAIGDCARIPDPTGQPYPATAQHAMRQGPHIARNIVGVMRGQPPEPFVYDTQGTLAALGCRTGVAQVLGVQVSGFWAWWLWRTYYLLRMPGLARKVRVALDWTLDLLFRRDDVQLGVHERR